MPDQATQTKPLYPLWPRQQQAMQFLGLGAYANQEPVDELLFGGQAGGGKSYFLRALAVGLCLTYPGLVIPIFRRTYPELEETHIRKIQQELPPEAGKYKADTHEWLFPNKSVLEFRYCERDDDVYRYQSAEWDGLLPDEATLFSEHQLRYLRTRVRSTRPGWRPIIVYTANPGGVGHHYIKSSFIDPAPAGKVFKDEETGKRKAFLKSRLSDNPALPAEYRRELEGLKDPALKRALLYGDWDVFAGQVFTEFRRDLHVIAPFRIPDHWIKWRAYDYGYGNPMCCLWFARVPGKRTTIVYRELYGTKIRDIEQAIRIKQLSKNERYAYSVADPAIWSKQPNGTSIAEVFAGKDVHFIKGNNDRLSGWQRVHEYLSSEYEDGEPSLYIFETCTNLIRTLPALQYDKNHVEDVDSDGEDHAGDTLRYGLMGGSAASQGKNRVWVQDFQVVAG